MKVPAESGPAAVASNIDVPSTSDAGTMWATRVPTTICCHPDALAAGLALSVRAAPPGPLRARLAAEHARRRTAVAGEIRRRGGAAALQHASTKHALYDVKPYETLKRNVYLLYAL